MVTFAQIQEACQRIADKFQPEKIILFGSYAYGTPNQDSDVDLLVIKSFQGRPVRLAAEILIQIDVPFPLDVIVRTPGKIRERIEMGDCFIKEVVTQGKVIYEAAYV